MPPQPTIPLRAVPRRTVAKGAAWAVPALTVASAAPMLAASTECEFGLDVSVTEADVDPVTLELHFEVTLLAGTCASTASLDSPLSLFFDLWGPSYSGAWITNDGGLTPSQGGGALTYTVMTTHTFTMPDDTTSWVMTIARHQGADLYSIPFTLSGTGVSTVGVEWNPPPTP